MTIPAITELPDAPLRTEPQSVFTSKANAFMAALPTLVTEQNAVIAAIEFDLSSAQSAISEDLDAAAFAKTGAETARDDAVAARDKANEWASKAEDAVVESGQYSALHYSKKAEQFKNSAENAAAAAQAEAGLPALSGKAGKALVVSSDESDVEWGDSIPSGIICNWSGSIETIPDGWYLCDGTNGTPDLRGRFVIAAGGTYSPGDTGDGSIPSHTHGAGSLATNSTGSHSHNINRLATAGSGGVYAMVQVGTYSTDVASTSAGSHSHTISGSTGQAGAGTAVIAKHYALAYIMKG